MNEICKKRPLIGFLWVFWRVGHTGCYPQLLKLNPSTIDSLVPWQPTRNLAHVTNELIPQRMFPLDPHLPLKTSFAVLNLFFFNLGFVFETKSWFQWTSCTFNLCCFKENSSSTNFSWNLFFHIISHNIFDVHKRFKIPH